MVALHGSRAFAKPALTGSVRSRCLTRSRKPVVSRTWGDAFGYLLVATGRMDVMIDPVVSPWDIAPLPVIMEEAGGSYTDLEGNAVLGSSAVASSGSFHHELTAPSI